MADVLTAGDAGAELDADGLFENEGWLCTANSGQKKEKVVLTMKSSWKYVERSTVLCRRTGRAGVGQSQIKEKVGSTLPGGIYV